MKSQYFTKIGPLKAKPRLCRHSYFRAILKRANRIMNTVRAVLLWWRVWLVHRPHSPTDWLTTRTLSIQHKHWQCSSLYRRVERRAPSCPIYICANALKTIVNSTIHLREAKKTNPMRSNCMARTRHMNRLEQQRTAPITTNRTGINVISYY